MSKLKNYINQHIQVVQSLKNIEKEIFDVGTLLGDCVSNGNKILLIGNGGSAADAQHIAAELVVRYKDDRRALPAIALTTDSSILTAAGNDIGYQNIFSRQIEALGNKGDCLIAISTSGNSKNIINAVKISKKLGITSIGLTGNSGGDYANECDRLICVDSEVTARIQECHIFIGHYWCERIEEKWL